MNDKTHDLHDFMQQISSEMASEYKRIQKRATEDPGTAGDQGEENWAELLRGWIPGSFKVVTKGRIISPEGDTSPQVDIIVLKSSYPEKLLNKKLYLSAGVAAVFECKTTLRASHIRDSMETCTKIKSFYPIRTGTPYQEMHSPIVYGLLAHSHSWKASGSMPEKNIQQVLIDADANYVSHPRLQLDIVAVSDLATWTANIMHFLGARFDPQWLEIPPQYRPKIGPTTAYVGHSYSLEPQGEHFTPVGSFIFYLSRKFAWAYPELRELVQYYAGTGIGGNGSGRMREWPESIFSDEIHSAIKAGKLADGKEWNEWSSGFW